MKLSLPKMGDFRERFSRPFLLWWYRSYRLLFFLGFFIVLACGGGLWYYSIHQYHWTPEQEKRYIDQTFQETSFKSEKFNNLVQHMKDRSAAREAGFRPARNLFE